MWPAQAPPITRPLTSKLQAPTGTKHPLLNVHVEIWKVTSPISPTKTLVASCILSYAFRLLRNIVEVLSDSDLPFPAEHLHERESSRLFPRSSITSLYLLVDMTTAIGFIQRCMVVLAIFLCYFQVQSESVDCEMYPFHHTCRGTMSRKRAMFPTIFSAGCDENKPSLNCIREFEERQRGPYIPLSKSSLLFALLNNNLLKDMTRLTHQKQRNNEMAERTPPLMDSFLSELESSDNY